MEIKINPKRIFSNYITVSELLQSLPVKALKEILNCRVREFLPSGKILFRQGDLEQDIFILVAGRLQFTREEDGKVLARGEFQKSDLLGELSIFTGEPRSATVTAIRDSELIRIPSALAKDILYRNPNALLQITKIISKRLAGSKGQKLLQIKPASCFSIFSCDEKDYLSAFLDTLQIIMQEFGESKIIHKSDFENAFDPNVKMKKSEKEHAILLWFQELESKYDYIFFVGEYKDTDWSKRCIRQSDRVLLYQDTSFENSKSLSETNILQNEKHLKSVDLILKHSDETLIPKKTINYLQNRNISRYYHIALNKPSTLRRMARRLIGKSLGLALGGGGAKGFAHLGVLKALEENRLDVDLVSGTSAGSVFAALISMGYNSEDSRKKAKELWVDKDLLNEYTIPVISLVSGRKYTEAIKNFFGEIRIEDLWIPYFAISTDLTHSQSFTHDSGFLWKAVRASTSLPGIVPPFVEEETIYVDGGLMDNVPGMVLKENGAGKIICVDVFDNINPAQDKNINIYFEANEQGVLSNPIFQLGNFLRVQNLWKPEFPPIGEILIRSMLVASRERLFKTEKESDLFLRIPTSDFGVLEWKSFSKLIQLGYENSKKYIDKFAKLISE